jgi:hypothetical protein
MHDKQLYIFVEGTDDERFVKQIFKPLLSSAYHHIKIIRYAQLSPREVVKFVRTIKNQPDSEYLFMCDMDARGDLSICITQRKRKEQARFNYCLDKDKIIVVKEEIESWYLAGITLENQQRFNIKPFINTETVTKEKFEKMIPKNFTSTNDFMIEVLKGFSLEKAIYFNTTLKYCVVKHILPLST